MPGELIAEDVNIFLCPAVDEIHLADKDAQITSGDAHGNAIKPIFVTVKHGIARNMTHEKYHQLVQIYLKSFTERGLCRADLLRFEDLLDSIDFKSEATLRLLGDLLADRGGNDYLTLLILARLHQCGVKYEIILSNHDFAFIKNYENGSGDFYNSVTQPCYSMQRLQPLLDSLALDNEDIVILMRRAYLPFLKLISYTVNEDNTGLTIYSHAPIGLTNIDYLARKLGVPFDDSSLSALTKTIDEINAKFSKDYVNTGRISSLVGDPTDCLGTYDPEKDPVGYTIWNRDLLSLVRPHEHNGYRLQYAHGHHMDEAKILDNSELHVHGLDNYLGKTISGALPDDSIHNNVGLYTVLYSHDRSHLQEGLSWQPIAAMDAVPEICYEETGGLYVDDMFILIDKLKEDVAASDSVLAQHEQHFLTQLQRLHIMVVANYYGGNHRVAHALEGVCRPVVKAAKKYFHNRSELDFQKVCRASFLKIDAQLRTSVFAEHVPQFVALAQSIEDLRVGVWVEQLLPPRKILRLSDKPATLFFSTTAVDLEISPELVVESTNSDSEIIPDLVLDSRTLSPGAG